MTAQPQPDWRFAGFAFPTTTPVPDQLFDELLHRLSGAELKVLLYIIRRTFGFKKSSDDISLAQLVNGIRSRNGKVLDQGTGLGKSSVTRALNSLEEKNIILRTRRQSERHGNQATTYTLNLLTPLSQNGTGGVPSARQALSHQRYTQQTVRQQTVRQQQQKIEKSIGGGDKKDLAAALIDKGIEERVAHQFTIKFNRQRIENNIDWFEWKLENEPNSIKTNPAGLLRRAIEQDYASEGYHQGFNTRRQKAAMDAAKKQRLATQQRHVEALERQQRVSQQQKEQQRAKRLEMLRERYQTTAKEQALWSQVLKILKQETTETRFNLHLAQSVLLSLKNDNALIAVPNRFSKTWLEGHFSKAIQRTLAEQLKGKQVVIQYLVLDGLENEHKKSATSPP